MTSTPLDHHQALAHAVRIVDRVCQIAGKPTFISDLRASLRTAGILAAIKDHNTPALFDWLMWILSFQGIADGVAEAFIEQHGNVQWRDIERSFGQADVCPKLDGYWLFHDCQYQKGQQTCAQPDRFSSCPLPKHDLRNGHLNQMAYGLFLFLRDVADGDLIAWIDRQLDGRHYNASGNGLASRREALLQPLRGIFGISDKVAAMALSTLLLGHGRKGSVWFEVGGSLVVIDTLIHNFLHRTGILHRFQADHPYGVRCYRQNGCAHLLEVIASQIDARLYNRSFPKAFPRFIQSSVWHFCAQKGLHVCNGNNIDESANTRAVLLTPRRRSDVWCCALAWPIRPW